MKSRRTKTPWPGHLAPLGIILGIPAIVGVVFMLSSSSGSPRPLQMARVVVTDQNYDPATVSFRPGVPARLTFLRTSDQTCGTEVVFPSLNVRRRLPLNQAVDIDFTPQGATMAFACGMAMIKGTILAQ